MLDKEVMERFKTLSEEERVYSAYPKNQVKSAFVSAAQEQNMVKSLLDSGKYISVVPQIRFLRHSENIQNYIEIIYMCSGNTVHIVNGTRLVLKEGELLIIGLNTYHETLPPGLNDIGVKFIVLPQFFDKTVELLGEGETPLRKFFVDNISKAKYSSAYLHFRVSDVLPIQNTVENLLWTLGQETTYRNNINQTTMKLLLLHLMNYSDHVETESDDETAIIHVLKYIEKNYKTASLTEIAEILHYDMFFLSKEIKRRTGKTYKELLQEKRLMQATYLLTNTSMGVDTVAENVGYSNISYFHRIFQKKYGMTPRTYRVSRNERI